MKIIHKTEVIFILIVSIFPMLVSAQSLNKKDFYLFHSFGHKNINQGTLDKLKIKKIMIYGHGSFWEKKERKSLDISDYKIKSVAEKIKESDDAIVCLNIEKWKFKGLSIEEKETNKQRFINLADKIKQNSGDAKIGFYGQLPQRNYWDPIKHNRKLVPSNYDEWQELNQYLSEISEHVDYIMPSIYPFYNDPKNWEIYARENISEAKKYGKPVIVFLTPQYHGRLTENKYVDYKFWYLQLETAYKYADGIIIWSPKLIHQEWDEELPWWRATSDFLLTKSDVAIK